jgi:protein-S-isoprenylcysteine O-methyltransferase Ste14
MAGLLFIGLFVVSGLDHRFQWSQTPAVVSLIAAVLVALGFFVVFLVFRENTYTSAVIEVSAGQQVIATGPYRVVRHPMYAGASVLLLASPVALGSWAAIPIALLLSFVVVVRLLEEERYLSKHLTGYDAYRRKVRFRLAPFIW